jgi:hypothetical protein
MARTDANTAAEATETAEGVTAVNTDSVTAEAEALLAAARQRTDETAEAEAENPFNLASGNLAWYGGTIATTAYNLDRRAPFFLPLRDKEGKIIKNADGKAQVSSDRATKNQMSAAILAVLRSLPSATYNRAGQQDLTSGAALRLTVNIDRKYAARDVRLIGVERQRRGVRAEEVMVSLAGYDGSNYVAIGALPVGAIVAIVGSK